LGVCYNCAVIKFKTPFYANTPDNTHCFQASIRMILKYFLPDKDFTWDELDRLTAKKEGLWTWPMQGLINLKKMGFDVIDLEDFDYLRLSEEGEDYLQEIYGKESASIQVKNSDMEQERRLAGEFLKEFGKKDKLPALTDIKKYLEKGYLVCCNVNAKVFVDKVGYEGHFVVVTGFDKGNFYINDPGLPPIENAIVPFKKFEKAWAYPDQKAKNVMAFKYKK
jgi:hypothetical protein